ncbi:MAG: sulfatase-like hydrolase/transferase [Erysipelotrichaceae bacterium]|nr:sulfatase-like hydrolase/transferase [Erysipelotrichaceae bacterium]
MRTIMVMFDTLTRKFLPNYGNDWVKAPNFERLAEKCLTFDKFYAGSLPCMPARRELHTGKHNFLHRGWGPLEPFDHSAMEVLRENDIYTHLVTDHSHYWEDGGCTYHNRYDTWEGFRGQEGDRYVAHDIEVDVKQSHPLNKKGISVVQHYRNRTRQTCKEDMPSVKTFAAGIEFLKEHVCKDNWFLQIEAFDPHEPFYVSQEFRKLYGLPEEETLYWPRYGGMPEEYRNDMELCRKEYAALISMCDESLGKVLDLMDENDMWKDTCLIVNTDHGFLLGEHEYLGKNFPPCYDELVHLPFFLHVPGVAEGGRCDILCSTVDIPLTLLDLYGCDKNSLEETDGRSILSVLRKEEEEKESVLFGLHGHYTCISDGRYVYMKNTVNREVQLYEYTLMPTNIRGFFSKDQLEKAQICQGNRFTNHIPCMKIPMNNFYLHFPQDERFFDLEKDPDQSEDLIGKMDLGDWNKKLRIALEKAGAPEEEFERLGI